MSLVQMSECGGFDLTWSDRLRKSIAKKKPEEFIALEKEYFEQVKEKKLSEKLCNYVWKVLVSTSRGYGFEKMDPTHLTVSQRGYIQLKA